MINYKGHNSTSNWNVHTYTPTHTSVNVRDEQSADYNAPIEAVEEYYRRAYPGKSIKVTLKETGGKYIVIK